MRGPSSPARLAAGYDFSPYLGFEIAWLDAGEILSLDAVSDGTGFLYPAGGVAVSYDVSGMSVGLNGYLPFSDRFRALGRVALLAWEGTVDVDISLGSGSETIDSTDLYLGLGVEGDVTPATSLGLNVLRYDLDGDDLDVVELALRHRFSK